MTETYTELSRDDVKLVLAHKGDFQAVLRDMRREGFETVKHGNWGYSVIKDGEEVVSAVKVRGGYSARYNKHKVARFFPTLAQLEGDIT